MREKGDSLVLVTTDRKLRHRFTLGVPSTFDQDCRFTYFQKSCLVLFLCILSAIVYTSP